MLRGAGLSMAQVGSVLGLVPAVGQWKGTPAYSTANSAVAANTAYGTPWTSPFSGTVDQMTAYVATGAVGSAKFAIYTAGSDNAAANLLGETSADLDTSASSTAITGTFASPVPVVAGQTYWLQAVYSGTPAMVCFNHASVQCGGLYWSIAGDATNFWFIASSNPTRFTRALTYVPASQFFPAAYGATTTAGGAPAAQLFRVRRGS